MKPWRRNLLLLIAICATFSINVRAQSEEDDDGVTVEDGKVVSDLNRQNCSKNQA